VASIDFILKKTISAGEPTQRFTERLPSTDGGTMIPRVKHPHRERKQNIYGNDLSNDQRPAPHKKHQRRWTDSNIYGNE
jgi:hypothetical protein